QVGLEHGYIHIRAIVVAGDREIMLEVWEEHRVVLWQVDGGVHERCNNSLPLPEPGIVGRIEKYFRYQDQGKTLVLCRAPRPSPEQIALPADPLSSVAGIV